jgi:hypothetical protein
MNIAPTSGHRCTTRASLGNLAFCFFRTGEEQFRYTIRILSEHLNIIRESFLTLDDRTSSSMTVKKYRPGAQSASKPSVGTDSDDGNLFDIPDSSPNSPIERPHNSDLLKTANSKKLSPDLSRFHLNLAEVNQAISDPDFRSSSPIYTDKEDMFNISDSPLRHPSPARSGLDSNLADANQDIFAISDSRSPSPIHTIDTEDMFVISNSLPHHHSPAPSRLHLNLDEVNQDIFAILDSRSPSPIYIDTKDMFMISDSPPHHPSPAPSKRYSNLNEANQDIFAIQDSPSPSPKYIDTEDMFKDSPSPSPKYIDTEDMFMVSDSPRSEAKIFPV